MKHFWKNAITKTVIENFFKQFPVFESIVGTDCPQVKKLMTFRFHHRLYCFDGR